MKTAKERRLRCETDQCAAFSPRRSGQTWVEEAVGLAWLVAVEPDPDVGWDCPSVADTHPLVEGGRILLGQVVVDTAAAGCSRLVLAVVPDIPLAVPDTHHRHLGVADCYDY